MMRYRILGIANFLMGAVILLQASSLLFMVIPKLQNLYEQADVNIPSFIYPVSVWIILLGITNIAIAYTQFTQNKQKYFTLAVIAFLIALISVGVYSALVIPAVLNPIYELTTQLG